MHIQLYPVILADFPFKTRTYSSKGWKAQYYWRSSHRLQVHSQKPFPIDQLLATIGSFRWWS
jgi:hypothetical protein